MVVVITEGSRDIDFPSYKLGFLLVPDDVRNEYPYARWVDLQEFLKHQCRYDKQRDDAFAQAFETLATLSGTQLIS